MPFIGRDWRSPGEAWVKTESLGWQRAKIIESSTMHPSACHMRTFNEYLDTSSCISPRSWPPKTECGKHMLKESKSHQKSTSSQRKLSHSWLKVVNSNNKINPIDTHNIDNACCCDKTRLGCPHFRDSKSNLSKSLSPDRSCCSSIDNNISDFQDNQDRENSCPRSDSANSSSSLIENYNSEQELLTSTPTVHQQQHHQHQHHRAPNSSYSSRLSQLSNRPNSNSQSQPESHLQQNKKRISQPISVKKDNELIASPPSSDNNNSLLPSVNESQSSSSSSNYNEDNLQQPSSPPYSANRLNPTTTSDIVNRVGDAMAINNNHQSACCQHHHHHHHHSQTSSPSSKINHAPVKQAPHCQITLKPTREVATYNTISEAFYRLDFCNAIHDIRRFNYICKLLHLLITQNLTSLSGCATRILFTMLEQVAWQVASNKQNVHILYNLLDDLKKMIQKYYCWGRPIGSSLLWQQHFSTIERISHLAEQIDIAPPPANGGPQKTINDLPAELIHEIMLRLNDYRDLVNSAEASSVMQSILNGQHIWRQLCKYHFSKQQLRLAIENHYGLSKTSPWSANVKFARFVSADGRSICRRPVGQTNKAREPKQKSDSRNQRSKQVASKASDCQEAGKSKQASSSLFIITEKNNQQPDKIDAIDRPPLNDLSSISNRNTTSSDGRGTNPSEKKIGSTGSVNDKLSQSYDTGKQNSSINPSQTDSRTNLAVGTNCDTSCYRKEQELDWEQVFHQLRKKFGLREEYADCLLLCRHCRCLFWKSFGHPCIKGEQTNQDATGNCSSGYCSNQSRSERDQKRSNANVDDQPRASVAALSQSYMQNANNQSGSHLASYHRNIRSVDGQQMNSSRQRSSGSRDGPPRSNQMSSSMLQVARSNLVQQPNPQSPNESDNNNLNNNGSPVYCASNNNGSVDQMNNQHHRQQQQHQQQQQERNNNSSANQQRKNPCTIPSHVAISPQAFLKFFSL